MGFGFSLFFIFVLLPLTCLGLLAWLITRKRSYGKAVGYMWLGVGILCVLVTIISIVTTKKQLTKNDIYGEYIVDRTKFPGKQADWQYDHFRFEITKGNDFIFYKTEKVKVTTIYRGKISLLEGYTRPALVIHVDFPGHHIIEAKPTLFRTNWSFYYVFHSPKFGNVFFKKGHWKDAKK